MGFKQIGTKPFTQSVVVKSAESTATIAAGSPVSLVMNGTNDGIAVVLPTTAAAAKATSLSFGVCYSAINPGAYGEILVYGFCQKAKYSRIRTRAASTDAYASTAACSVGQILSIDTLAGAQSGAFQPAALGAASGFLPYAVLCETLDSIETQASTSSMTHVASFVTGFCKVFLRMM
jgi:hypothetical protein